MMERYNDEVIYRFDGVSSCCVFTKDIETITTIDQDKLAWHRDEEYPDDINSNYLTLQEIGDQVRELYPNLVGVLYVWVDGPLNGVIYQTGNYTNDDSWIKHGDTIGYA